MDRAPFDHGPYIARALATDGGHLAIGRGGYTIHYGRGCTLSGYECDEAKAECAAAGLPVIDSRGVPFEVVWRLAVSGPMIAVGEPPGPEPCHALSYAPLSVVAEAYRAAGADVLNLEPARSPPPSEAAERTATTRAQAEGGSP